MLLVEASVVPSVSLARIANEGFDWLNENQVLIIPPFVVSGDWDAMMNSQILHDKARLLQCLEETGVAAMFQSSSCYGLRIGPHGPSTAAVVNYAAYWEAKAPYNARAVVEARPHFVANIAGYPLFDERFVDSSAGADQVRDASPEQPPICR